MGRREVQGQPLVDGGALRVPEREVGGLARLQRAESFYDKNNYAEAKKLYETLATAPDADLQAQGTAGVIRSLSGLKDAGGLESYA